MIYVIQAAIGGPVKIGHTTGETISRRLAWLQIGCPWPLLVVRTMPGTQKDEWALHRRFAEQRLDGEWFEVAGDLADWLGGVAGRVVTPQSLALVGRPPISHEPVLAALIAAGGWLRPVQLAAQMNPSRSVASVSTILRSLHSRYGRVQKREVVVDGYGRFEYRARLFPADALSVTSMSHNERRCDDLQGVRVA